MYLPDFFQVHDLRVQVPMVQVRVQVLYSQVQVPMAQVLLRVLE
jgi:hypothetical protein